MFKTEYNVVKMSNSLWSEREQEQLKLQVENEKWKILRIRLSGSGNGQYNTPGRKMTASQINQGARTEIP